MFLAVKKFWKVIFGSCSNCKLVDVKNRSHDSPGAWERFILDSQTKGEVYYQHIMGNHLNLACLVSGLLFPCSKDRNEAIKAWPIHLPRDPLTHAHTLIIIPFIIQQSIHLPLAKTSILKKESEVQIHWRKRSAKQQGGSNLETRVYSFLSFCSFLSLCLLRFYFNHVC